ncbi:MAG: zinc ribbon domain-containing protein [Coriobacteriales bacterium]|jgi:uncharacterized OB-fold protein|nr:zinc ribbon domain-containing protein [Coriobacteriales bacterium]
MGFFDSLQDGLNANADNASEPVKTQQLESQLESLEKSRVELCAQLGASVFDEVRLDPAVRGPREALVKEIEELDERRSQLSAEIAHIVAEAEAARAQAEAEAEAARAQAEAARAQAEAEAEAARIEEESRAALLSAQVATCPSCGGEVGADDYFCTACGTSLAAAQDDRTCASCGDLLLPNARFCMSCGTPVPAEPNEPEEDACALPEETSPEQPDEGPARCSACGEEVLPDYAFCTSCGAKLD